MSRKFLPTIDQLKRACEELPNPMDYEEDECVISVTSGKAVRDLNFKRMKFAGRSGGSVYRWVYDGKIMIRYVSEADKKRKKEKEKDDDTVIFSLSVR